MVLEDLKNFFLKDDRVQKLADRLTEAGSKTILSGYVGSADAFIASAVMEKKPGVHVFILEDKETAAYFHNNLENLHDRKKSILFFPAAYRQPYQIEKTDNSNVVLRAEVLSKVAKRPKKLALVTYPEALAEKVVTKNHLEKNTLGIKVGEEYSIEFINELLIEYEFEKVDYVYEPGQFAVRGGIVDVFSFSNDNPYRIEFFGDEVESIRTFDPADQLSIKTIARISIVPNVQQKLLQESRQTLFEFLPSSTNVWMSSMGISAAHLDREYEKARYAYDKLDSPLNHLTPSELYLSAAVFEQQIREFSIIGLGSKSMENPEQQVRFNQAPQPAFNKNFDLLLDNLRSNEKTGYTNIILSGVPKQIERIYAIFEDIGKDVHFNPITTAIHEGFVDHDLKIACYTDHQIFDRYHRFRLKEGFNKNKQALTIKELSSLNKGDFVVHVDHGVGKFSGLEKIDVNGKEQEAIRLVYDGNDILYVSIHSLHRISKYSGKDGTQPKMNKLGSPVWNNKKQKTKKRIKEVAYDLIQLYAKRKASKGFAFAPDTYLQNELEASFIFEDTPDQEKSTAAVKEDMESPHPMDRLICGDVGFGKTEIAIRAAFKAATDGKQVAVLVPTTILTIQHYKNFSDRLKDFPMEIDYINRFRTGKKLTNTLKKLESGQTDIIIGTHKLVGKRVNFKDLGLLIIDEEQKFGVGVKDKLKTLRENVDTLTLTATPIPRTLQFSLMGARDLSIINTPPPNRYPVQTELRTYDEEMIRDAINYELGRGGQVFFVHNRIQNIKEVAGMLQRICPDVRIAIGHGQMEGKKLEEIMLDFMEGLYDVLLATSIIESGIDVPNANTMIINNANNFGLSDLHQLRGRVGRSNKKAFCYLITPPQHMLTTEARKRLRAIEQFSELGSGFNISMRDLDIRGAGDLLGAEQSGFISDIGYEMYQKILQEAINELKESEFKNLYKDEPQGDYVSDCQIETDLNVVLPTTYVNNVTERLQIYKELDDIEDENRLKKAEEQLIDRFGPIPEPTRNLFNAIRLRWIAKEIGFEKIVLKSKKLVGYFVSNDQSPYYQSAAFSQVLDYIRTNPAGCKMSEKKGRLRLVYEGINSINDAIEQLEKLLIPQEESIEK